MVDESFLAAMGFHSWCLNIYCCNFLSPCLLPFLHNNPQEVQVVLFVSHHIFRKKINHCLSLSNRATLLHRCNILDQIGIVLVNFWFRSGLILWSRLDFFSLSLCTESCCCCIYMWTLCFSYWHRLKTVRMFLLCIFVTFTLGHEVSYYIKSKKKLLVCFILHSSPTRERERFLNILNKGKIQ